MRTSLVPLLFLLPVASAGAQTLTANFEAQPEGWFAPTYTEGLITLQNLDRAIPGGGTEVFSIERAEGTLAGQPGFTPINTMGFGGYSPGDGAGFSRCKSFDVVWGGALAYDASIELYELGNNPLNTCTLEALNGGVVVAADTLSWPSGFGLRHHSFHVTGTFDSLRLVGAGPDENGAFFAIVDTLRVRLGPGLAYCAGDGVGTACPCGNTSAVGAGVGCLSSLGTGGMLRASGTARIGADTVVLEGSQMPNSSALYFQGTASQGGGVAFGDGLRCAGGTVIRLGTKFNAGGASRYPVGNDQPVSIRGQIAAPGSRYYQVWYRNAASFCTPSTFNLTNGLEIVWS